MIYSSISISHINFTSKLNSILILLFTAFLLFGCSSTKRFSGSHDFNSINTIRVFLDSKTSELIIAVNDELIIADDKRSLAKVASGNKLRFQKDSDEVSLTIGNKDFSADRFFLLSDDENEIIKIDGRQFRGRLVISNVDSEIKMVNQIGLEDYVKGVMTKEMPIGKGTENYDALKAFSICARTYAYNKINENKNFFDIYPDTRDQVYGGVEGETNFTNEIVDETAGQILVYENEPAIIFYHSTCGGFTEDVSNVFSKKNISYLSGIKDGDEPYCKISPRFEWTEEYSESTLIERLFNAKLIESKRYRISDINIKSRFNSGRVNELEITLKDNSGKENNILISGNRIRSIIRSADDKSILRSTFFNTDIDNNKNIIISGKGNGHGVGLCQWGAIGQSKKGIDFEEILNHYFPGTKVKSIYD